jgi:heat shock protein HslJ
MSRTLVAVALAALITVGGLAACGPKETEAPAVPTAPMVANAVATEVVATPTVEATEAVTATAALTATGGLTVTGGVTTTGALTTTRGAAATGAVTTTETLTNAVELDGTAWAMFAMGNPVKPTAVLTTTNVTIAFAGGLVTGSTGCTPYSASYVVQNDVIRISPPVLSGAACTDARLKAQEEAYLKALAASNTWKGDALRLKLISSDNKSVLQYLRTVGAN